MVKDFLTWLDATTDPNEGDQARLLKELLADRSGALWQAGTLDEARTIVERYAQEKQSPVLLQIFDAAIDRFEQLGSPASPAEVSAKIAGEQESPARNVTLFNTLLSAGAAVFVIALALLITIFAFLWSKPRLELLADVTVARGVITFLFTVGTIGLAVLMVSALFLASAEGLNDRFDRGKEVLTALVAILGTVVGFYFGSEGDTGRAPGEIAIGAPVVFPSPAPAGGEVQVAVLALGGRSPFTYAINLGSTDEALDSALQDVVGETESGLITQALRLPDQARGKPVLFDLEVSDDAGNSAKLMGIEVTVEAPAEEAAAAGSGQTGETTEDAATGAGGQ